MQIENKICRNCLLSLPITLFYKDSSSIDGLYSQCKLCKNENIRISRLERAANNIKVPTHKTCPRCTINKTADKFTRLKTSIDGLAVYCKECRRLADTNRKNKAKKQPIILDNTIIKKCVKCEVEKPITMFRITRKSNDNVTHICLDCLPKNNWTKEKQRISEKKYRLNNPDKIKEKNKKAALNINRRVRNSLNNRIKEALFTHKVTKNNTTTNYIGCDIPFFKKWIEYQFIDDMSWDNYGKWHLDHVTPCFSYDLSNDKHIAECFNWKNYRPLWAKDNMEKSNKIDTNLIELHKIKANDYKDNILSFSAQVKEGELLEYP